METNECDDTCIEVSIASVIAKKFKDFDLISHLDPLNFFARHQNPSLFANVSSSFILNAQDYAFISPDVIFRSAENFLASSAPVLCLRLSQLFCQKTKSCLSFLRILHASETEFSKCVHVASPDWIQEKKPAAQEPLNVPAISIQNEFLVLCSLKSACECALLRYQTTYEEDFSQLNSKDTLLPLARQNILKLLLGEKRTLKFWISVSSELLSILQPIFNHLSNVRTPSSAPSPAASEFKTDNAFAALRSQMEKSDFAKHSQARKYFREVWSPLLKGQYCLKV